MSKTPLDQEQILEGKIFAILAYLSILCIIPLILKKENTLKAGEAGTILDRSLQ